MPASSGWVGEPLAFRLRGDGEVTGFAVGGFVFRRLAEAPE